jgi:thiosulfate dehydrogenase [quinone] large subunit
MNDDELSHDTAAARAAFKYVPRALLVILRVHLGVILLITVLGKLTRDAPFSAEMLGFLQGYAMRNASGAYQQFLQQAVIPHATLFSYLIMAGELVAGLSLLTGTATRLGAAVAMLLFLNYMLAKGRLFWSPDSEDAAVFFSALVVLLGAAGRVWGVDAYLARRWPRVPFW